MSAPGNGSDEYIARALTSMMHTSGSSSVSSTGSLDTRSIQSWTSFVR